MSKLELTDEYSDAVIDRSFPAIRHCLCQTVKYFNRQVSENDNRNSDSMQQLMGASERLCSAIRRKALNTIPEVENRDWLYRYADEHECLADDMKDISAEITKEEYLRITMPGIIPKKERGSTDGMEFYLYPKLLSLRKKYPDLLPFNDRRTICYFHCFGSDEFQRTGDMDNFERNYITDAITLFCLKDDTWRRLDHYATGVSSSQYMTLIYVVPSDKFPSFLSEIRQKESTIFIQ